MGFEVVGEASDCRSALAEVAARHPDVVLLDVQLPDDLAVGVAETLREAADRPAVVLISVRDASDYGPRVAECGAAGFIAKTELSVRSLAAASEAKAVDDAHASTAGGFGGAGDGGHYDVDLVVSEPSYWRSST